MLSENMRRLRQQRNLSQLELAHRAKLSLPAYRAIETGKAEPKAETLKRIAAALGIPLRDLLIPVRPLRAVRFRAGKKMSRRAHVLANVSRWLGNFNELENLLADHKPYRFGELAAQLASQAPGKERARHAAQQTRTLFDLTADEPIHDICGLLESGGIKVFPLELASEGFFGLSVAPQDGGPAIVVNVWERISVERWIFTAAHELGHLILHLDSFKVEEDQEDASQETEANELASNFLMPDAKFCKEWQETYGLPLVERVLKVKRIFGVSYRTVLYRLIEAHDYPNTLWREFQIEYRRMFSVSLNRSDEPRAVSPDSFQASMPEARRACEPSELDRWDFVEDRLRRLVRLGVEKEEITLSRGAEILSLKLPQMRAMAAAWEA
jgi:Zn-dependent peptidase ImmA (M78 family)/transcriptional regulator with XRE-family HTH domain